MSDIHNFPPTELESLQRHNRKLSNALREIIKEVRDHRYRLEHGTPDLVQGMVDNDLYDAVEYIAAEFGGLYGQV